MRTAFFSAIAVVAACAGLATSASAYIRAEPEFGRCVKTAKGESSPGFSDPGCTKAVEAQAHYRFVPGPGPKPGFTASAGSVVLTLYNANHKDVTKAVECSAASTTGEFTGTQTESLELTLSGCKSSGGSCQSAGEASGVVAFSPMEGLLVLAKHEHWGEALIRWSPAIGETLASFECAGTPVAISDSILHEIRRNKQVSSEPEVLRAWKTGDQRPNCYEPCTTGELPMTTFGAAPASVSGLTLSGTQADEEAIEADTLL